MCGKSGADRAQMNAVHGYLYFTFLSPAYNLRNDRYGGSLEERARVVLETAGKIRKSSNGVTPDLISRYANFLKSKIDMLEILCGLNNFISTNRSAPVRKIVKCTYGVNFSKGCNLSFAE